MSNVARRALVTLLDSPSPTWNAMGSTCTWRPRLKWLAACESAAIGDVSLHVLDRFPVRFPLGRHAGNVGAAARSWTVDRCGSGGGGPLPSFPAQALARASEYFPPGPSIRREIALSRLARALAQLDGVPSVTAGYVDEAATVMGLTAPISKKTEPENRGTKRPRRFHGQPAGTVAANRRFSQVARSGCSRPPDLARLRPTATTPASRGGRERQRAAGPGRTACAASCPACPTRKTN